MVLNAYGAYYKYSKHLSFLVVGEAAGEHQRQGNSGKGVRLGVIVRYLLVAERCRTNALSRHNRGFEVGFGGTCLRNPRISMKNCARSKQQSMNALNLPWSATRVIRSSEQAEIGIGCKGREIAKNDLRTLSPKTH